MDKELLSNMKAEEEIIAGPSTSLVASNNLDDLNRKVLSNHLVSYSTGSTQMKCMLSFLA